VIDEGLSQHKHLGGPGAGGAGEGGDEGAFGQGGVSEASRKEAEQSGIGNEGSPVPNGSDQTEPARSDQAPEGDDAAIMGKLPHARPQRRSAKRTGASRARRAAPRPASVRAAATPRRKPRAATTKAPAAAASARKQRAGLPKRAIEAAVSTAAIPIKFSAAVARRAGGLIGRNIRSR